MTSAGLVPVKSVFRAFFNAVNPDMAQYWDYATGRNIQRDSKGYATNRMPLWIKPSEESRRDASDGFHASLLEGTELDMSKDMEACTNVRTDGVR